jgi:YHS domain-containing protein
LILAFLLIAAIHTPEECLVTRGKAAVTVEHQGKSYGFRFADCREEFLTDPERYAQLYDALLELQATGAKIEKAPVSLVPS